MVGEVKLFSLGAPGAAGGAADAGATHPGLAKEIVREKDGHIGVP